MCFLYGCETSSFSLKEKHGLRVLRRIFRPKREEVAADCRRLNNEELHKLLASPHY
jgi:hypothetical protein